MPGDIRCVDCLAHVLDQGTHTDLILDCELFDQGEARVARIFRLALWWRVHAFLDLDRVGLLVEQTVVEKVEQDLILTQISDECLSSILIEVDGMCVGCLLPTCIDTAMSNMLMK